MRLIGTKGAFAAGAAIVVSGVVWVAGAAAASTSGLTLHAGGRYVIYGHSIALSGSDTAKGQAVPRASIDVQADEFPFSGGFHTIAIGHTNVSGRYRVTVHPSHATRYRVSIQGNPATSPTVTVYVVPGDVGSCNLCGLGNTSGRHALIVADVITAPTGPIGFHGPEYFYYAQDNGSNAQPATVRLVQTVPLRRIAANTFESSVHYQVHFPARRFQFSYETCYRYAETQDGLGLPGHHHCGDATLRTSDLADLWYVG